MVEELQRLDGVQRQRMGFDKVMNALTSVGIYERHIIQDWSNLGMANESNEIRIS